jgi:hypothetical protein
MPVSLSDLEGLGPTLQEVLERPGQYPQAEAELRATLERIQAAWLEPLKTAWDAYGDLLRVQVNRTMTEIISLKPTIERIFRPIPDLLPLINQNLPAIERASNLAAAQTSSRRLLETLHAAVAQTSSRQLLETLHAPLIDTVRRILETVDAPLNRALQPFRPGGLWHDLVVALGLCDAEVTDGDRHAAIVRLAERLAWRPRLDTTGGVALASALLERARRSGVPPELMRRRLIAEALERAIDELCNAGNPPVIPVLGDDGSPKAVVLRTGPDLPLPWAWEWLQERAVTLVEQTLAADPPPVGWLRDLRGLWLPASRRGRPKAFESREQFMAVVGEAVRRVRARGRNPSSGEVARQLRVTWGQVHRNQLLKWCRDWGWPGWEAFLRDVRI